MKKVNVGVCGLGGMGLAYCLALSKLKNTNLVAVCDQRKDVAQRFASDFHATPYDRLSDMVERSNLEAVVVATPNSLHAEQTVVALGAGKHVLCTKPMATTLAEADSMIAQSRKSGVKLEIGFQYRYDMRINKAKQMIDKGELGKVFLGTFCLPIYRGPDYWAEAAWRKSVSQAGGGVLPTHASHDLDYIQWFFGDVDWVVGRTDTLVQDIEVEDTASAILKFKSGAIASLIGTTAAVASRLPRFEVFGEKGTLSLVKGHIEGGRPCDLLFSSGKEWKTIAGREPVSSRSYWSKLPKWTTGLSCVPSLNSLVRNLQEFLDSIISDKEPLVSGEEGRKSLEIMVAIYESSMKGQLVRFPVKPREM